MAAGLAHARIIISVFLGSVRKREEETSEKYQLISSLVRPRPTHFLSLMARRFI
jgi:hypothetical protein